MPTRSSLLLALLPLVTALACGDKDGNGNDGTSGADTGDTGSGTGGDGGSYASGCITVDGGQGFASLNDAIEVASEGATISLESCSGTLSENVWVRKSVTIEGGGSVVLTAKDDVPLTIAADGVTVRDLQIQSEDHGLEVDEGADVVLSGITITDPAGWGLRVDEAEGLTISDLSITGADKGGIRIKGGSAQLSGVEITELYGYGLRIFGGAEVSLAGSTIRAVAPSSESEGLGVSVEDSSLASSNNLYQGASAWNVYATDSSVTSDDDSFVEGSMGLLVQDSDLSVSGAEITNPQWCGIYAYAQGGETVSIEGTTVLFEEGATEPVDPDTWIHQAYVGAGMFLIADDVTVSDSSITGTPGVGMLVNGVSSASASLSAVSIRDVSQYGLYLATGSFVADELSVSGVTAYELSEADRCVSVDQDVGVLLINGELSWTGGAMSGSEGYGLSAIDADAQVSQLTVSDNGCAGIMGFGGGLEVTDSDFSGAAGESFGAALTTYQGTGLVATGNSFHDNSAELFDWSYDYGDGVRTDYYAWFGSDVQLYYGGHAVIEDNSFANGVTGVAVISNASYGYSTAELRNNSFSNYKGAALAAYDGSLVAAEELTVDGFGLSPIYCDASTMSLDEVSVADGGILSERYEVYTHDKLTDSGSFTSYGPAVYASECDLQATSLSVTDARAWGVYLEGGTNVLNSLELDTVGASADADGLSIYASSTSGSLQVGTAQLSRVDRYGVVGYASGSGSVDLLLSGIQVDDSGLVGLVLQNDAPTTATATASITSSSVTGSGAVGLYSIDFDLGLLGLSTSANGSDGLYLDGGTAEIKESSSYDNAGYGLYCDGGVSLSNCELTFSGNGSGDTNSACEEACGEDIGDTGM